MGTEAGEVGLQLLIHPLHLVIGLGMIARGKADHSLHELAELPPEPRDRLGSPIRNHLPRKAMEVEDLH